MTVGASGTFAINGTDLSLSPTRGRWIDRQELGFDGAGHPIYPAVREFELSWQLINASDFYQVVTFYNTVKNTGTVAVDLPEFGASGYVFRRYSGCVLGEPTFDGYFVEHSQEAKMLIYGIQE